MLKILSPKTNVNGVSFNRKYQNFRALELAGFPIKVLYYNPANIDEFYACLKEFKPNIFFEASPSASLITEVEFIKANCPDTKVILDFDDAPAKHVLPSSPAYAYMGEIETGQWKDRVTRALFSGYEIMFDIARNKRNNERLEKLKSLAHKLLVPTWKLREELLKVNKHITVIPNVINHDIYKPIKQETNSIRIGWVLGFSHSADWADLRDSIASVLNEHDNTEFVLWSNTTLPLDDFPMNRVEVYDTVGILDGYHKLFSNLNLDIGIAHVGDEKFNEFKSNLKINEYAAIGAMPLASNKLYSDYITDGVNGALYNDPTDFRHQLSYYIQNETKRKEIAESAQKHTKDKYDLAGSLPAIFNTLLRTAEGDYA